jgi:hypothetical protein
MGDNMAIMNNISLKEKTQLWINKSIILETKNNL